MVPMPPIRRPGASRWLDWKSTANIRQLRQRDLEKAIYGSTLSDSQLFPLITLEGSVRVA
jgi:hypothetical protein